jgi:hypothetical protein
LIWYALFIPEAKKPANGETKDAKTPKYKHAMSAGDIAKFISLNFTISSKTSDCT